MIKNKVILDVSIAALVDITNIRMSEKVVVTITAEESWEGNYEFTLFNSQAKNTHQKMVGAVVVNGQDLLLTIEPMLQQITAGSYWYEIYNTLTKRIEFMGDLKIEL